MAFAWFWLQRTSILKTPASQATRVTRPQKHIDLRHAHRRVYFTKFLRVFSPRG